MSLSFTYSAYLWLLFLVPLTFALGLISHPSGQSIRRWSGLWVRAFLLTAMILALAGIQLRISSNLLTTVFVLDVSDSISPKERARGEDFIRQSIEAMKSAPGQNQAAIVLFGEDALVDRLASQEEFSSLTSIPVSTRTDIASALQLAQAILPGEGARRIVLLSDGRENVGQAMEQAAIAGASQIELSYVPLGGRGGEAEVLLETLTAPAEARQGERIELRVDINSNVSLPAILRVFADDALIHTQELTLEAGQNRLRVPVEPSRVNPASGTGFRRFRAQIIPAVDTLLQNNEASAFTVVHGPPNILLIEGQPDDGENLARSLEAAGMNLTRIAPAQAPATLSSLAGYDAVVLVNVRADAIPDGTMQALPVFVRDLGRGLVMVGGTDAYGAGGYLRSPLEEALPVEMDVRDRQLEANLALVLAVDKSGSMGRCHCDDPDLNQTYTRQEVGQPKVDIAKEAVMRAASALGKQDYLGVVAFDNQPRWVVELNRLVDPASLENSIAGFQAEGQTNMQSGVQAAYQALQGVEARRKHIILLTDGWVRTGDLTEMAQEMKEQGITLSVVAAGEGSAEYLAALSQLGGGSYYPATDIFRVPEFFLKETVKSVGEYIVEEPFYPLPSAPGPVLRGLDTSSLPPLLGYNGTTGKNTARMDLLTPRGDPLLATWQFGLGRSAAWTSDLKGQWAKEWLEWPGFERFAPQLVGWVLPAPKVEGLTTEISLQDGDAIIQVQAIDKNGQPLNFLEGNATIIDPDMETVQAPLKQVGAGLYQATTRASQPGTYLVRLGINQGDQSLGQATLGFVVPYSPEYRASGVNESFLGSIAKAAGGRLLTESASAFDREGLVAIPQAREIWAPLLLGVALLFPLDVAVRRLLISKKDFLQGRAWLVGRLSFRPRPASEQPRLLGQLFQARDRARHRREIPTESKAISPLPSRDAKAPKTPVTNSSSAADKSPDPTAPEDPGASDSLARLHQAKKRARR
jgi:Mg-chelatase subunit ChlD